MRAYKLMKLRQDGSIGPLLINCRQRIPLGEWLAAEAHPTKGFAVRPGWHVAGQPHAPHLSMKGRAWYEVEIEDYYKFERPGNQGGEWLIAEWMKVIGPLDNSKSLPT